MRMTFLTSARRLTLATVALCLLGGVIATTALAAPGHVLSGSIGVPVTGGLAVNQSTSDIYVADSSGISEISSGTPVPFVTGGSFTGLAVDSTSGTVYAIDPSIPGVNRYDSLGAPMTPLDSTVPAGFFNPTAVAVDPSTDDVFVANADPNGVASFIEVYGSDGTHKAEIAGPVEAPFVFPNGLAIDGSNHLYVLDGGAVNRYSTAGAFEANLTSGPYVTSMTADPTDDDVFVAQLDPNTFAAHVTHYGPSGAILFDFGTGQITSMSGIGVDGASDKVYVADSGAGAVQIFDPALAPDVTTGDATATADSADLTGLVDPLGQATTYHYEWGIDATYGSSTDPADAGSGTGPVPAPASLSGLLPNQLYHFRLVAANSVVSNVGADATFTTDAIPAAVSTGAAENVRISTAKLNATVNPNNAAAKYHFEYGTTTAYEQQAPDPAGDVAQGVGDVAVSQSLTGLEPATTYHYRISANNGTGGDIVGGDQTFTTLDALTTLHVDVPTDVTKTSATLHGSVDNHGFNSTYFFTVKATDSPYVSSTPQVQLAPGSGPQTVSAPIGDLPIGSGFEVRLVATTTGGTVVSDPIGFRSEATVFVPLAPPIVNLAPYGCTAPHLNAYTAKAKAGKAITLTGSDLGVGGVVSFGASLADADSWSANAIRVVVPSGARGSAAVKVDCSRESNTIKVGIAKATAKHKAKAKKCKKGYVKKKVKGKTRCVKKPKARKGRH